MALKKNWREILQENERQRREFFCILLFFCGLSAALGFLLGMEYIR